MELWGDCARFPNWEWTRDVHWCGEWRARQADAMSLDELRAAGANLTQWEREP